MKKFVVFFLILFPLFSQAAEGKSIPDSADTCLQQHLVMIDSVITYGKQYIGVPYKYGGKSPSGFDCSGFVHYIFEPWGYNLPYSSKGYGEYGQEVDISQVRKGDFALFRGRSTSSTGIGHVALVVDVDENGNVYILHATIHKGITIDNISNQEYYLKRYLTCRRMPVKCDDLLPSSTEAQ